jgi:hypothetical protein
MKKLALALITASLIPTTSLANEDTLSRNAIKQFYSDMAKAQTGPVQTQVQLLQKHMSPAGQFTVEAITDMSAFGVAPQSQTVKLTRDQVIEQTKAGAETMQITSYKSNQTNIQISPDGKSAVLLEHNSASAVGDLPMPSGKISVKMQISGNCNDHISLNKGVILIDKSTCKITTVINPVSKEL